MDDDIARWLFRNFVRVWTNHRVKYKMVGIKKKNKIDYEDFPEGPLDFWENY